MATPAGPMMLERRLRQALDAKAKPVGSLGRIEDLAVQLGLLQGTLRPAVMEPVVLVFAGDHGAVASGISAYPSAVTAAMVGAYVSGGAAINLFAQQAGARLLVVDAGVAAPLAAAPGLLRHKVAPGTADWTHGPAMTAAQAAQAVAQGGALLAGLVAAGTNVVALGEMGIGNTASAALLAHKVAGLPLHVGPGAGLDAPGLDRKREAVARGAARTADRLPPMQALAEYGGFEIAMLAGAVMRAAELGVCVVIDGVIATAAVLLAVAMRPDCRTACVFAHRSAEPGHAAMLTALEAAPLLDLGLRLGEGTGAALALPLLRAACTVLSGMADLGDLV